MNDNLELLKVAQSIRDYHHRALWEEEKHFTWLLSVLVTGMVGVFLVANLDQASKSTLLLAFGALGCIFSLFAYRVVRRESIYFHDSNVRFMKAHALCFPDIELLPIGARANKSFAALVWSGITGRAGVRDIFQLIFVAFFIVFALVVAINACVTAAAAAGGVG